jgi:hypothetical protein
MTFPKNSHDLEVKDVYQKLVNDKYPFLNINNYFPGVIVFDNTAQQITGDVAGWKQVIADHRNATTTLQGTRREANTIRAYLKCKVTNGANLPPESPDHSVSDYDWYGSLIAANIPSIGSATSLVTAEDAAAAGFLAAAQRALSSFQGGTFIGELAEAIHGIRNPAKGLRDYLVEHARDAKRLAKRGIRLKHSIKRINKAVGELWLERSYHWLPLVGDLESAAQSLARLSTLEDAKFVSFEGFDKFVWPDSGYSTASFGPMSLRWRPRFTEESKVRFYGQVVAFNDLDPGSFSSLLATRLGLNLSQAFPTMWELIPFSFVADYFSNTGAMISAYSFPSAAMRWCNRAILQSSRVSATDLQMTLPASTASQRYEWITQNPGGFNAKTEQWLRTPFDISNVMPSFHLTIPGIGGWAKWLNLTALYAVISSPF